MPARKQLIDALAQRIAAHAWVDCTDLCFRALFHLPAKLQIEVARLVMSRYVAILEAHFPDVKWPREILKDPEMWLKRSGRSVPEDPELVLPSDATFLLAIDGLLLACSNQADDLVLTSSCVYAIDKSIHALMQNVWAADDPEAAALWRKISSLTGGENDIGDDLREFTGRSPEDNVAALAVREREWKRLAGILTARKIWEHPEPANEPEVERALQQWKERESSLLTPLP
jgi:hypothetical protein